MSGVGVIASAVGADTRINARASAVQLCPALTYQGRGLGQRVTNGLDALLIREGYANVTEAVGTETRSGIFSG